MLLDSNGNKIAELDRREIQFNTIRGPGRCMRNECEDPERSTDRFSLCLLVRGFFGFMPVRQIHVGLQVCKDCMPHLALDARVQLLNGESGERIKRLYLKATHAPADLSMTQIAWFELGRYKPVENSVA